jgi:DNA polymerase III sliding clamp (beta) subunit (PCNA family)
MATPTETLGTALRAVSRYASRAQTLPLLYNRVRLHAYNDHLDVQATTIDLTVTATLPWQGSDLDVVVDRESCATVPPTMATVAGRDNMLVLTTADRQSSRRLAYEPLSPGNWPSEPDREWALSERYSAEWLRHANYLAIVAKGAELERPLLGCVRQLPDGLVATDGYRAAFADVPGGMPVLLPAQLIRTATPFLGKRDGVLTAYPHHIAMAREDGSRRVDCQVITGPYPPVAKALPRSCDTEVTVSRDALRAGIGAVTVATPPREPATMLVTLSPNGTMCLLAKHGAVEHTMPVAIQRLGANLRFAVNARYVAYVLDGAGDTVSWQWNSHDEATVMQSGDYRHLIMPMWLDAAVSE